MTPSPPIRLLLTPEQAATLRDSGAEFVAGSPVGIRSVDRPALILIPCGSKAANDAARVAQGTHRAVVKSTKPNRSGPKP